MSTSTGTTPACGYCGKPVINAGVWHLGVAYHQECVAGPGHESTEVIRAPELVAFIAKKDERIADLERQLRATTDLLRVFYQSDEDTADNPIMKKVGRQVARSEKLLTTYRDYEARKPK